jgi:hypothetical protein
MIQTASDLVAAMNASLRDMALGDIARASQPGETQGAKLAGFLLGFCFVDAVAGFYAGRTKESRGTIGRDFRAFVSAYMREYEPAALYDDLRNGLVHSYAIGATYAFTHLESDGKHLQTITSPALGVRTLLNLENFVADVTESYEQLCADIHSDATRFEKARRRYESIGLIQAG